MQTIKAFFRRLFCMHRDPRAWTCENGSFFSFKDWETRELWRCSCGKEKLFKHLEDKNGWKEMRFIEAHREQPSNVVSLRRR